MILFQISKLFGGGVLGAANFFDMFDYRELLENMRQRTDPEFGSIMLNARVQALTGKDIKILRERVLVSESGDEDASIIEGAVHFVELQRSDPSALALFATNKEVDEFNRVVMETREMEVDTFFDNDVEV